MRTQTKAEQRNDRQLPGDAIIMRICDDAFVADNRTTSKSGKE